MWKEAAMISFAVHSWNWYHDKPSLYIVIVPAEISTGRFQNMSEALPLSLTVLLTHGSSSVNVANNTWTLAEEG
jgi:hypothetical protein